MYEYKAIVIKVVDGDTFDVNIDLGFNIMVKKRLRLLDCDAPEHHGPHGERAKELTALLQHELEGREVVVRTRKDRTGKYGRVLAYVVAQKGDVSEFVNSWVDKYVR